MQALLSLKKFASHHNNFIARYRRYLSNSYISNTSYSNLSILYSPNIIKMNRKDIDCDIHYFDEVMSTMDKAREIYKTNLDKNKPFAVVAGMQTNGRGTRGRTWTSEKDNLFLTMMFKMSSIPVPLTLMPLRIGTLIGPSIQARITSGAKVTLKWPNDVLVDNRKICGVLIEIENGMIIVGIGCNVRSAPSIDRTGPQGGRPSVCIYEHNEELNSLIDENSMFRTPVYKEIASEIVGSIYSWLYGNHQDNEDNIINDFQSQMSYEIQMIRGDVIKGIDESNSISGEEVIPIRLNIDGTLTVKILSNNKEKILIADYLY